MIGKNVNKFPLTKIQAEKIIRELAKDSGKVILTDHVKERITERGFDTIQMFKVLRNGYVDNDPVFDKKYSNWKCKIVKNIEGGRDAGVVTAIISGKKLVIITMEWEDL